MSDMILISGGSCIIGSDRHYPEERPARSVEVEPFHMDATPVTNEQFKRFVTETGYVTLAESAPDPAIYPDIHPALAVAGSAVFMPPDHPVDLHGPSIWWRYVPGADWQHPYGPDSNIERLADHPVVHIAYADALAYAAWAGKSLPTEAEWEFAARGGLDQADFAWGDALKPAGQAMAKIWSGRFPHHNSAPAGFEYTAPVRNYPPNGYGLYDMIGNVWEWTSTSGMVPETSEGGCCAGTPVRSADMPDRILKGGSHLCAPEYCQRYRPAARWFQPIDTTTTHVGFRCIERL